MKIIKFAKKWAQFKRNFTNKDLEFFYKVMNLDGTVGRVFSDRNYYHPRYMAYWFAVCRCHWNVVFPLWLLNNRSLTGKYLIITNELHSAIINTETSEVYDPTYESNGVELSATLEKFKHSYKLITLIEQIASLNDDDQRLIRFHKFLPKGKRTEAALIMVELFDKHFNKTA